MSCRRLGLGLGLGSGLGGSGSGSGSGSAPSAGRWRRSSRGVALAPRQVEPRGPTAGRAPG
eukprot:scaffold55902_cov50-Phaeocystis_antarctica.AAC.3